jgi:hypothetical protein
LQSNGFSQTFPQENYSLPQKTYFFSLEHPQLTVFISAQFEQGPE